MKDADATIIVPQHGHAELTRKCLDSLRCHDPVRWPVVVVDDGSTDGAEAMDIAAYAPARLIRQRRRGVSAAWNRGAAAAATRWLVFLNNDTLSGGAWVNRLLAPLRGGEAALAGVGWRTEQALPAELLSRLGRRRFLPGWCFAISAEQFLRLGGFDESLRVYWSDTDLQLRVARDGGVNGAALSAVSRLPLRHLGHRTAHDRRALPRRRECWRRDRAAFIAKWQRE